MSNSVRAGALLVALVLTAALAGTAGASTTATRSAVSEQSFCSTARSIGKELVAASLAVKAGAAPASLKTQLGKIRSKEHALRSSVPRKLKTDLSRALHLVDLAWTDFSKANWNLAAVIQNAKEAAALEAASTSAQPAFTHIKRYLHSTCKLPV